jgi:hypothetical protein
LVVWVLVFGVKSIVVDTVPLILIINVQTALKPLRFFENKSKKCEKKEK